MDAAQLAAVLTQMQAQAQQQAQQMQQQSAQQLQQIIAQLASQAQLQRGPRLASPTLFDGSSDTLDAWKADLLRQFTWYNTPGDADRIRVATAHMTGAAGDWWTSLAPAARPTTWVALVAALEARFQPINSSEISRNQMYALTQGKKTVQEYIDIYRRLLARLTDANGVVDMAPADQLQHFRRGLRPAIATQLDVQGITTLDAAITLAVRLGSRLEMAAASSSNSSSSSSSHHAPMDLDAMDSVEGLEHDTADDAPITRSEMKLMLAAMQDKRRQGGSSSSSSGNRGNRNVRFAAGQSRLPTIPHLTPEQVKEYMDADKCFGCGSKEHRSRGCPKRKVGADGRVSWSN